MSDATVDVTVDDLSELLRPLLDRALFGFDVDGVLAPIVEHADAAELSAGVGDSLRALGSSSKVAIVSGRSLESLGRLFDFPAELVVIGSHGLERRGSPAVALDDDEQYTFDQLEILGTKAVEAIGEGAWLERKPASVVVHTREADPGGVAAAIAALENLAGMVDGAQVKRGHEVVELLARTASKAAALARLSAETGCSPLVYLGDDVTDEDVFVAMGREDVSVRVGPGETAARLRIDGPDEVADLLRRLTSDT